MTGWLKMKIQDETKENVKEVGHFALPVFAEQATITVMGLISSLMVSNVSPEAVAGVNMVETLNNLIQSFFLSLQTGAIVVISQFCGRRDRDSVSEAVAQALFICVSISIAICSLMAVFSNQVTSFILSGADAEVLRCGTIFFTCALISFPFLAVFSVSLGSMRASGSPGAAFVCTFIINVSYVLLGLIFAYGFSMGVLGVGVALIIARMIGAVIGIILIKRGNDYIKPDSFIIKRIRWDIIRPILLVGIPSCVENVVFMVGRLTTQVFTVSMGTAGMAANAISNSIHNLYNTVGMTASATTIPIIGKYLGMRNKEKAVKMTKVIYIMSTTAAVSFSMIMWVFLRPISGMFTRDAEIQNNVISIIRVSLIIAPVLWYTSFVSPAALRASGDSKFTSVWAVITMIVVRVPLAYLFSTTLNMGIMGIWLAMYTDWAARSVIFGIRLKSGRWLDRRLV